MLSTAKAVAALPRGRKLAGLGSLKAAYAAKLHTVRSKYWSDLVGLHEELVHLTTQLNPGDAGTRVAKDKHGKLKIFLEHVRKAMKALQMIPEKSEQLGEGAVDKLEDHISRVLLPIKVRLETLREAMASETLNLAMLGEAPGARGVTSISPHAPTCGTEILDGRKNAFGTGSPDSVRDVFDNELTPLDVRSPSRNSLAFSVDNESQDPLSVDVGDTESLSQPPFDLPFHEIMDDLDDKLTMEVAGGVASATSVRSAPQPLRERPSGDSMQPLAKRQRVDAASRAKAADAEIFETVLPCSPPSSSGFGASLSSCGPGGVAVKEETMADTAAAFNLQPREVKYQCAICNEAYSVTFNYNPWWALRVEECPHCKKKQVPRLDISHPTNQIDYLPALSAVTEAMQLSQASEDKDNEIATDTESDMNDELALSPEKSSKLLILICHARTCPGRHLSKRHAEVCKSIKYLMLHIRDCSGRLPDGQPCPFEWCRPCKNLLSHLVKCFDPNSCAICNPWNLPRSLQQLKTLNQLREQVNASAAS